MCHAPCIPTSSSNTWQSKLLPRLHKTLPHKLMNQLNFRWSPIPVKRDLDPQRPPPSSGPGRCKPSSAATSARDLAIFTCATPIFPLTMVRHTQQGGMPFHSMSLCGSSIYNAKGLIATSLPHAEHSCCRVTFHNAAFHDGEACRPLFTTAATIWTCRSAQGCSRRQF